MNKRVIVGNSQKVFNLKLEHISERESYIEVMRDNSNKIKQDLKKIEAESEDFPIRDDNKYLLYQTPDMDAGLAQLIFKYGGEVIFYSNTVAPDYIIELLAENRYTASVMYSLFSPLSYERALGISKTSTAGKTTVDTYLNKSMTPFDIMTSLVKARYSVDTLYLDFEDSEYTPEQKYAFFNELRDAMSAWRTVIVMIYRTEEEYDIIHALGEKDKNKRVITTTWEQH